MTNVLSPDKVQLVRLYASKGWSRTAISVATGVSLDAVKRQVRLLEEELGRYLMCPCGKRSNHHFSCEPRVAQIVEAEMIRVRDGRAPVLPPQEFEDASEEPVVEAPPVAPSPPPTMRRADYVRRKCPQGYCEMHLDHVVKAGSYEIEYWKCSCNEERTERRVATNLN